MHNEKNEFSFGTNAHLKHVFDVTVLLKGNNKVYSAVTEPKVILCTLYEKLTLKQF